MGKYELDIQRVCDKLNVFRRLAWFGFTENSLFFL